VAAESPDDAKACIIEDMRLGAPSIAGIVMAACWFSCDASAIAQSHYIRRDAGNAGVIVFVHGLLGDAKTTWTNSRTGAYWPELMTKDAAFNGFDVYVYEYPSPRLANAYSPDEVAEDMRLRFDNDGVSKHQSIVFLAHSLGGIVTRAFLMKYRQTALRVKLIYFFSTPTTGSDIARLGALISKNPQFNKVRPMTSDSYLADLQRQWLAARFPFPSYCAYEKQPTLGQLVVEQQSATNLCNQRLDPIDANHIEIVKPEDVRSVSYIAFRTAFNEVINHPISNARPKRQQVARSANGSGGNGGTVNPPARDGEGGGGPNSGGRGGASSKKIAASENAVGSIIVQPGGAASVGQKGGITVGQLNITGKIVRTLDDQEIAELATRLGTKTATVSIDTWNPDQETTDWAIAMYRVLHAAHWTDAAPGTRLGGLDMDDNGVIPIPKGIHIYADTETNPIALFLQKELWTFSIKSYVHADARYSGNRLRMFVGAPESVQEEKALQSFNGRLFPASDPIPANPCGDIAQGDVLLLLGNNAMAVNHFPQIILRVHGRTILSVDRDPDGSMIVMLEIRSADNRIVVRLNRDGFIVNPNNYLEMRRPDRSTLYVTDQEDRQHINARYANPKTFVLNGAVDIPGRGLLLLQLSVIQNSCLEHGLPGSAAIDLQ